MSRLTRDGTAEPVSRDQILRHARGQGNVHFPCSADHEQDWQPYPVDPYSAIHTYIHILRPTWERELDLQAFRHLILAYWANGPDHHQPNTRQYQQLRINAAAREIARAKDERHIPRSYRLVLNDVYCARFLSTLLPIGVPFWYHSFDESWWLGKVKHPSNVLGRYVVRFLDNPGPALIGLPESAYNTALHAPCGSWCLQTHGRTNPLQGVLHG